MPDAYLTRFYAATPAEVSAGLRCAVAQLAHPRASDEVGRSVPFSTRAGLRRVDLIASVQPHRHGTLVHVGTDPRGRSRQRASDAATVGVGRLLDHVEHLVQVQRQIERHAARPRLRLLELVAATTS